MKKLFTWLPPVLLTLGVIFLFCWQRNLERRFQGHWHFFPKPIQITIDEPHLSSNVPYHITPSMPKTPPKKQPAYVFWSYVYCYQ